MHPRISRPAAVVLFVVLASLIGLAACGGEGEPAPADTPSPPAAAVSEAGRETGRPAAAAPVAPPLIEPGSVTDVVLVTIDTLRADVLGYSGGAKVAETPAIDRLASTGRVFTNTHAHSVVTLPSHANILTGLYPFQHGIRDNSGFVLPLDVRTIADYLSAAGFVSGAFVAAFPLDIRYGLGRAFEVYDDSYPEGSNITEFVIPERPGDEVVAAALAWWRSRAGHKRLLWVHLYDPHAPYDPPEPYLSRYPHDPYLGEVAVTDAYLQPLLAEVTSAGGPPALVVLTSDHGEALGAHGELTHGFFAYEPTLKVPLILWAPGLPAGETGEHARHVDILPTVIEAVGQPLPNGLPGRSLLHSLADAGQLPSYFEALAPNLNRGWAPLRGVLREGTKFISLPLPELYDLEADPGEEVNLVREDRARTRAMLELLPEESVWPPAKGTVSDEEEQRLRALGYVSGSAGAPKAYTAEDDPKNLVQLDGKLHEVIDLFHRRRLGEAETLAREVVAARPSMALGWTYLAQVLLEAGRLDQAIEVMREARGLGAASPVLTRQLALSLAEVGRAQDGLALLAPLADTGDPDLLNALGLVLSEAGDQRRAQEVLQRVFQADPSNPLTHQHLALTYLRLEDWQAAKREAERSLAANDRMTLAWNYLGTALYNLGDKAGSADALGRAVGADPANFDALYNLAVVALEIGDYDRAREALRRFVDTAPERRYGRDIAQAEEWLRKLDVGR